MLLLLMLLRCMCLFTETGSSADYKDVQLQCLACKVDHSKEVLITPSKCKGTAEGGRTSISAQPRYQVSPTSVLVPF